MHNGLGTIYLTDLTDEDAKYSATATAKVFEGGKAVSHFVTDGWLAIFGDSNDVPNRFVVDFTLDDGTKFQGRYDGELPVGDEWTFSGFREDVTQNELVGGYMRLKDPDYMYEEAGVNQWELFLMSEGVSTSVDEYGSVTIHGPGDCFRFEVSTDMSVVDALPVGTYEIKNSYEAGVAQQGNKSIGFIGIYLGAWFHRIGRGDADTYSTMGLNGTLKISKAGEQYTIETTFYDDARNTISGKYVGIPTIVDHRTPEEPVPMSDSFMKRSIEKALKKHSTASTPYQNRYKQRVEEVGRQLK